MDAWANLSAQQRGSALLCELFGSREFFAGNDLAQPRARSWTRNSVEEVPRGGYEADVNGQLFHGSGVTGITFLLVGHCRRLRRSPSTMSSPARPTKSIWSHCSRDVAALAATTGPTIDVQTTGSP